MVRREGKCLCGEIAFTAELESENFGACHCDRCRRWAGGPLVEAQATSIEFTTGTPVRYGSSEWAERVFCPTCGTHLAFAMRDGSFFGVNAGAFDPPLTGALNLEVFIDRKPGSYAFVGDHPRMTGEELMAMMQGSQP